VLNRGSDEVGCYPSSFHVYRWINSFPQGEFFKASEGDYELVREAFFPCLIADIVAGDNTEVAARLMYVFSKQEWERYICRRAPIKINEDNIVVEESEV
jgi:hypothetical protein